MELTSYNDAFFYKDFKHTDEYTYRIFNYRLAGWEEFHTLPGAMECRGIMYRFQDEEWKIVCRPMEKFFNSHEGGVTHDWSNPQSIMTKEDGSLISTFVDAHGELGVKSKGSLSSDHAIAAMKIIDDSPLLYNELMWITTQGLTVNMEYTSPLHRIVLSYNEPSLTVLSIRCNRSGEYLNPYTIDQVPPYKNLKERFPSISKIMVKDHYVEGMDVEEFVESISSMKGIEGFVIRKNNREHVKLKTEEYLVLHHYKDNVNNPKSLYKAVLEEATDDLRELFVDDKAVLKTISKMEKLVRPLYNAMEMNTVVFHSSNEHLDRKSYAIKAKEELDSYTFHTAMMKYLGKPVDLKQVMMKRWDDVKDTITEKVYG